MGSLKEQIIKAITPLIKLIAKDIETIKRDTDPTILNSIENPPKRAGQLAKVGGFYYLATGTSSKDDWKRISIKSAYSGGGSWIQAFTGVVKLVDYKEKALCTLDPDWEEMRIEYKFKGTAQPEFALIYNDINSASRKAYSLGQGVADIVMETNGELKCFSVSEPNVRIASVYYK